ncbi:glucose 1-dehydrogenase [Paucilactobacillus kaifaensis]|uniref:glucose 1-dehydrogenase n=1 Tax=Paucilactobacillus kaifaensis TaxID=2559921 RepID=UPI0010F62B2C|nr:glucose 1-dehydrogenase [Paucilactobacillus kaifaensis]
MDNKIALQNFDLDWFSLKNKVALITGGASGIGKSYSIAMAKAGADVFSVSASQNGWEETRRAIEQTGQKIEFLQLDITNPSAAEKIVTEVIKRFGRIDILVNNAGMQHRDKLIDFPSEDWQKLFSLNVDALFYLSQAVGRVMVQQQSGKIINIASLAAFVAAKGIVAYTATKHAVAGITKSLATELGEEHIQINAIAPGYIKTPLSQAVQDDPVRMKEIMDHLPDKRFADPVELSGTLIYLASHASDYVNGQILVVDGGYLVR